VAAPGFPRLKEWAYAGVVFEMTAAAASHAIVGDALFTRTEVVGLKKNSAKPGRAPTGLMALRITTIDQADRLILDFYRCAMLPLRHDDVGRQIIFFRKRLRHPPTVARSVRVI